MFGYGASVFMRIAWCVVSPLVLIIVFIMIVVKYEEVTYEGRPYPAFAVSMGNLLAAIPILPIPICAVYGLVTAKGSFSEVF